MEIAVVSSLITVEKVNLSMFATKKIAPYFFVWHTIRHNVILGGGKFMCDNFAQI